MNIIITGKAGAGKDEFARILVQQHGYTRVALADRLKTVFALLYPAEAAGRDPLVRRHRLQRLGDDLRSHEPRVFSRALAEDLEIRGQTSKLVLTDARYVDEWEVFRERFPPCRLVRVTTPDPLRFERLLARDGKLPDIGALAHPSENGLAVADIPGIIVVDNGGAIADLEAAARRLLDRLNPPD